MLFFIFLSCQILYIVEIEKLIKIILFRHEREPCNTASFIYDFSQNSLLLFITPGIQLVSGTWPLGRPGTRLFMRGDLTRQMGWIIKHGGQINMLWQWSGRPLLLSKIRLDQIGEKIYWWPYRVRYLRNWLQLEWRHWWRHEWSYQAVAELDAALVDCLNAAGGGINSPECSCCCLICCKSDGGVWGGVASVETWYIFPLTLIILGGGLCNSFLSTIAYCTDSSRWSYVSAFRFSAKSFWKIRNILKWGIIKDFYYLVFWVYSEFFSPNP